MELGGWLRSLGLEQYEAALRQNAIDESVLPDLTEDHLREIGIPLGARIKLLKAIAALDVRTETVSPTGIGYPAAPERRQLTVMFCDLIGSTALAASMDPEDLREIISAYQKCAAETVRRFDGFVARYMGDGVLVYFGYPQAHEDDAERAANAGLELIAAVAKLRTRAQLQARVGIATGLVVVGDIVQEHDIVGETPNLAARLQGIAEPNTVVIADATRRLLGFLFDLKDLGSYELKGIAAPTQAWSVLRPSSTESRFEALHADHLTALVGREEEMNLLIGRWSKAKTGEGQIVLVSGEAGIGKSRLTAALLERLAGEPHSRLRYFCSPQYTNSAFYPIIGQMERAARMAHDDSPSAKLDKLDALLAQAPTSKQDAALLAELLSLPSDGRYPALDLAPQQRRQRTLKALVSQIRVLTRSSPVLMIFEDVHWIDPSSLEVLDRTIDRISTLPVLLIVTFRPEFTPPWKGPPFVTTLTINRLRQHEVGALIDGMIGHNSLPASIRQDIIERTDGIPLFIEELTKAVLEAGEEGEARQTVAVVPSTALAVPASLHASLMARLDRLGRAKEVAQIGATIGREFSHALLAAVSRKDEAQLNSALDSLVRAGLLFRQGLSPHASYLFKHVLVQDAAYSTLLRGRRRELHARIMDVIEGLYPDRLIEHVERLAHHAVQGEAWGKALTYCRRAGAKAAARSAYAEAMRYFEQALGALSHLPETRAMREHAIDLRLALRTALVASNDFGRGLALLRETEGFAAILGDSRRLAQVSIRLSNHLYYMGEIDQAVAAAKRAVETAAAGGDNALLGLANLHLGVALYGRGDYRQAIDCFGHSVAALGRTFDRTGRSDVIAPSTLATHHDELGTFADGLVGRSDVIARSMLAECHAELGTFADGLVLGEEGLSIAEAAAHPVSCLFALQGIGRLHVRRGNLAKALLLLERALRICREVNIPHLFPRIAVAIGDAYTLEQRLAEAVPLLTQAVEQTIKTMMTHAASCHVCLADAQMLAGRLQEARVQADLAFTLSRKHQQRGQEAYSLRLLADVAAHQTPPQDELAEGYYRQAFALAEALGMRPLVAHCHRGLGNLYSRTGQRRRAQEHFAMATAMYRDMGMQFWLTNDEPKIEMQRLADSD